MPSKTSDGRPLIGRRREVGPDVIRAGRWSRLPSGKRIWRVQISDPGALGVQLHFRNFHTGAARVWVHSGSAENAQSVGPYAGDGPWDDGEFWAGIVWGENVTIEYEGPTEGEQLPFELADITQFWEFAGVRSANAPGAQVDTSCMPDATCYQNTSYIRDFSSRVVYFTVPVDATHYSQCTGTMINDRGSTGTPWMLTAGHCIEDATAARQMSVYWDYRTSVCNGAPPFVSRLRTITGATLIGRSLSIGNLDYAFVRLSGWPEGSGRATAGWSTRDLAQGDVLYSVSHPRDLSQRFTRLSLTGSDRDSWILLPYLGRVDHGSSGSAAFDEQGAIRATLSSGRTPESVSACTTDGLSSYSKFSQIYENVKTWLESTSAQSEPAELQSPAPNSTLPDSSVTFSWSRSSTATEYFLYIGNTEGGKEWYGQNTGSSTSAAVSNLPTDGRRLYVRVWTHLPNDWYYKDYVVTAATRRVETVTQIARMTSPQEGSTLAGSTVTFTWTRSGTASEYFLYAGSAQGERDYLGQNTGTAVTYTATGLPTNGGKVYVRLWSHLPDGWWYYDYVYTAAQGGGPAATTVARIVSPTPGSTLAGSSVTFTWSRGNGATEYHLYVGTSEGGKDIFDRNAGTSTSMTVSSLPVNGSTVYVRIWTHLPNDWYYVDFRFTAAQATVTTPLAQMISPIAGTRFGSSQVTFTWTRGAFATEYFLYVGTTPGGRELFAQNHGLAQSGTVAGIPQNGAPIYVRLWTHSGEPWFYYDYVYTAAGGR